MPETKLWPNRRKAAAAAAEDRKIKHRVTTRALMRERKVNIRVLHIQRHHLKILKQNLLPLNLAVIPAVAAPMAGAAPGGRGRGGRGGRGDRGGRSAAAADAPSPDPLNPHGQQWENHKDPQSLEDKNHLSQ